MKELKWYGHSYFKITTSADKVIVIDPYNNKANYKADYILSSHSHYDHFSEDDILPLVQTNTKIFAPADCKTTKFKITNYFKPNDIYKDDYVKITGISAYNINKQFHPKKNNWLGYIIEFDNIKIYHSGDTDIIPEMKIAANVDYALMAVGGTYTMTADEAAEAVNTIITPKIAIPMHWGSIVGSESDAVKFSQKAKCKVEILKV